MMTSNSESSNGEKARGGNHNNSISSRRMGQQTTTTTPQLTSKASVPTFTISPAPLDLAYHNQPTLTSKSGSITTSSSEVYSSMHLNHHLIDNHSGNFPPQVPPKRSYSSSNKSSTSTSTVVIANTSTSTSTGTSNGHTCVGTSTATNVSNGNSTMLKSLKTATLDSYLRMKDLVAATSTSTSSKSSLSSTTASTASILTAAARYNHHHKSQHRYSHPNKSFTSSLSSFPGHTYTSGSTSSKKWTVQVPKRMILYTMSVFLVLPVGIFVWKESVLMKAYRSDDDDDMNSIGNRKNRNKHLRRQGKPLYYPPTWIDETEPEPEPEPEPETETETETETESVADIITTKGETKTVAPLPIERGNSHSILITNSANATNNDESITIHWSSETKISKSLFVSENHNDDHHSANITYDDDTDVSSNGTNDNSNRIGTTSLTDTNNSTNQIIPTTESSTSNKYVITENYKPKNTITTSQDDDGVEVVLSETEATSRTTGTNSSDLQDIVVLGTSKMSVPLSKQHSSQKSAKSAVKTVSLPLLPPANANKVADIANPIETSSLSSSSSDSGIGIGNISSSNKTQKMELMPGARGIHESGGHNVTLENINTSSSKSTTVSHNTNVDDDTLDEPVAE